MEHTICELWYEGITENCAELYANDEKNTKCDLPFLEFVSNPPEK